MITILPDAETEAILALTAGDTVLVAIRTRHGKPVHHEARVTRATDKRLTVSITLPGELTREVRFHRHGADMVGSPFGPNVYARLRVEGFVNAELVGEVLDLVEEVNGTTRAIGLPLLSALPERVRDHHLWAERDRNYRPDRSGCVCALCELLAVLPDLVKDGLK